MIETVNLTKRFDDIAAVDHMGTIIRDGSVFGLIGTNGAGKSTFLRLASGMLKPDEGCITIDGHKVSGNIPTKKRSLYIPDEQYSFNNTAPEEMIHYYGKVYQESDEARFHKLMGDFSLDEKRKIHTSSKGTEKQVSAICGVCADTDYLSRGKTSDGLDPVIRQAVKSIFAADMEDGNLTPITASRDLRELKDICDRMGLLHKDGIPLPKDLDGIKLNIHRIQCVLKPGMRPEDLASLDKVNTGQRGSLCAITTWGSGGGMETVTASYEPVFFEYIPLSPGGIFISETEVAGHDVRKLIL